MNQIFTSSMHATLRFMSLLLMLLGSALGSRAQSDYYAGDLQLRGLMDGKLKIEMLLTSNGSDPLLKQAESGCFEVYATYYYRTQLRPIPMRGKFCIENHSFYLVDRVSGGTDERFDGTWDPAKRSLTGTWKNQVSGKTLPFALSPIDANVSNSDIQKFYTYLTETCSGEPDAEGASLSEAIWSTNGGKIVGFEPAWHGDIEFLSPLRFKYYSGYSSTARSSYYVTTYQLLPTPSGLFLLGSYFDSNFDKPEMDEPEGEGSGTCHSSIFILRYANGTFEDLPASMLPPGYANDWNREDENQCDVTVLSDAMLLPDGSKIYWDGTAFVKK